MILLITKFDTRRVAISTIIWRKYHIISVKSGRLYCIMLERNFYSLWIKIYIDTYWIQKNSNEKFVFFVQPALQEYVGYQYLSIDTE